MVLKIKGCYTYIWSKRITAFLSRETLPETHNSPSTSLGTSLRVTGHVGYASQLPFILNATFHDNTLFGRPYDPVRYDNVIEACCLRADINLLSAGDITEIGERGVTLSGGQKQRLSITRTVYTKHDASRQNRRNIRILGLSLTRILRSRKINFYLSKCHT